MVSEKTYACLVLTTDTIWSIYIQYVCYIWTIPWFAARYLVASYIAFALICAIGSEQILRWINTKIFLFIVIFLSLGVLRINAIEYHNSLNTVIKNPSKDAIEKLKCSDRETIIINDPRSLSLIPWYIYLNDPMVMAPDIKEDIVEIIEDGIRGQSCFILQENRNHKKYNGTFFEKLTALPNYKKYLIKTYKGTHVPDSAWLFKPANIFDR